MFHDPDTRGYRMFEGLVWVLIVVSIGMTFAEIATPGELGDTTWFRWLDRLVLAAFTLELILRVATFRPPEADLFELGPAQRLRTQVAGRLRFMFRPLQLIDLLTVMALVPELRGLRALRVLRLVRSFEVFRYANPFAQIGAAFVDNAMLFVFAFSVRAVETIVGGLTIFLIESGQNGEVKTIGDGMWWTLVTLTTVGYGDITPVDGLGRWWGAITMVAGMFTLALFAGIVGHTLLNTVLTIREEQFRMTSYANHIIVCGYDSGSRLLLDALSDELEGDSKTEVVLFGPGERPSSVPPEFRWVSGDPLKQMELHKVHLSYAKAVLVLGTRTIDPQGADANTILTLFTISGFMREAEATLPRKKPLYLIAEILDAENTVHARAAGADEVIASAHVGFSLLAHTVVQPGTAAIMSRVVAKGHMSIFVGSPGNLAGRSFKAGATELKQQLDALLIGLQDPETHEELLNPPDDTIILPSHSLIYLAAEVVLADS